MKSTRKTDAKQRTGAAKPARKTLRIDQISLDGETQPRAELNQEVIAEYKDAYLAGVELPPVVVFTDGAQHWLADGFHRRWAAHEAGMEKIKCIVHAGTAEDARWFSYAVNQTHGLRRSRDDKEKAVSSALRHRKGRRMSDRKIAEHVGVSHTFVAKVRAMQSTGNVASQTKREGKDGRVIETAKIGKTAASRRQTAEVIEPVDQAPGPAHPCPNCGCRTRDEYGDCASCKEPLGGQEEPVEQEPVDDHANKQVDTDGLIEAHAQLWDKWGDWRVAVANIAVCCKQVDAAVVADALEDLAADIRPPAPERCEICGKDYARCATDQRQVFCSHCLRAGKVMDGKAPRAVELRPDSDSGPAVGGANDAD